MKIWRRLLHFLLALAVLIAINIGPFNEVSQAAATTSTATSTSTLGNYAVFNSSITYNGQPIVLHGVNWFGFDTPIHTVDGLWARSLSSQISQMQSLGINAVRLPFCPASLTTAPVSSINYQLNPSLVGLNARQLLLAVATQLDQAHIYILMDYHTSDCSHLSPLWYTNTNSEAAWISQLTDMTSLLSSLPYFLGVDLHNEPYGATWGTGNTATDWNLAAARAGEAVLATDPHIVIIVEGIWENPTCSSDYNHFWGENLEPERCTPIALPSSKLVLSAHVFGTDISDPSYYKASNFPANMPAIWDTQFGSLAQQQVVLIGEWGGKMGTDNGSTQDLAVQQALTDYLSSRNICESFYWSWGPNSQDTGGLLEDDWQTIWPVKIQLLESYFDHCNS